jgi:hypothetical protein
MFTGKELGIITDELGIIDWWNASEAEIKTDSKVIKLTMVDQSWSIMDYTKPWFKVEQMLRIGVTGNLQIGMQIRDPEQKDKIHSKYRTVTVDVVDREYELEHVGQVGSIEVLVPVDADTEPKKRSRKSKQED